MNRFSLSIRLFYVSRLHILLHNLHVQVGCIPTSLLVHFYVCQLPTDYVASQHAVVVLVAVYVSTTAPHYRCYSFIPVRLYSSKRTLCLEHFRQVNANVLRTVTQELRKRVLRNVVQRRRSQKIRFHCVFLYLLFHQQRIIAPP